jgi:hypothetical protein
MRKDNRSQIRKLPLGQYKALFYFYLVIRELDNLISPGNSSRVLRVI